jgi:hypothetical protein
VWKFDYLKKDAKEKKNLYIFLSCMRWELHVWLNVDLIPIMPIPKGFTQHKNQCWEVF